MLGLQGQARQVWSLYPFRGEDVRKTFSAGGEQERRAAHPPETFTAVPWAGPQQGSENPWCIGLPRRPGPGLMEKPQDVGRSWSVWEYEAFSHNQFCLQTCARAYVHCLELWLSGADRGQLTAVSPWGRSGTQRSPLSFTGETKDHIHGEAEEGRVISGGGTGGTASLGCGIPVGSLQFDGVTVEGGVGWVLGVQASRAMGFHQEGFMSPREQGLLCFAWTLCQPRAQQGVGAHGHPG